jgi:tRNA G10  N-methylase Trm11
MSTKKRKNLPEVQITDEAVLYDASAEVNTQYGSVDTSFLYEELHRKFQLDRQPIEVEFRKLVNWVRIGDQYTHQIHTYPAKLLPNIAHFFVRASSLARPKSKILDPFCGSGTVALEASLAGHTPLVADANPLSLLITAVKTSPYVTTTLRQKASQIISRAGKFRSAPEVPIVNSAIWYEAKRKKELEKLLRAIQEEEDVKQREFFLVCFSSLARRLSLADPAISVPVRLKQKANFSDEVNRRIENRLNVIAGANVRPEFFKICLANIERIERANLALRTRKRAVHVGTDARCLSKKNALLASNSVPLIITSPPYGSAQKYIRASSLSLNWLGLATPDELARLEAKSIGREHVPGIPQTAVSSMSAPFLTFLEKVSKKNPLRHQITVQYLNDMRLALLEMSRVLSRGGTMVMVVGNNQVCGEILKNDEYCISVLKDQGLELQLHLVDKIKSRGLLTKRNSDAPIIARESVLVFSK